MSELLHQASCVAIGGRGLLIEGAPGSGKSSLALALIDRGAMLVGDDGVALARRPAADGAEQLWASPPPNISGLLEVRGVGLVRLPVCAAPVALAIRLEAGGPRLPDGPDELLLAGSALPLIRLDPAGSMLMLRAEQALALYGTAAAGRS